MELKLQKQNILRSFIKLYKYFPNRRKKELFILIFFIILSGIFDFITIGAIVPFLTVLVNPQKILEFEFIKQILFVLNISINNTGNIITTLCLFFGISALTGGLVRTLALWKTVNFSSGLMSDLSIYMYKNLLYMPFSYHLKKNSSEVITALSNEVDAVTIVIQSALSLITTSVASLFILMGLLAINLKTTSLIFLIFGGLYLIIIFYTKGRVSNISKIILLKNRSKVKLLQESISAIRDVLIQESQNFYIKNFNKTQTRLNRDRAINQFFVLAPRYIMEAIGIFTISIIALWKTDQSSELLNLVPLLGALALGAQKLLPLLQLSYTGWNTFSVNRHFLESILYYLGLEKECTKDFKQDSIDFKNEITIKNLDFGYKPGEKVLENINFKIKKGSKIGIVGKTGSGKTSLINLLMCLQKPNKGGVYVDGKLLEANHFKSWCKKVTHVPQDIFLLDSSIEENIAFGIEQKDIDENLLKAVAKKAKIAEYINSLKYKFKTIVGERGVRMSGGQRQRIGIARALYQKADILIFDEITSSLDTKTAINVMKQIIEFNDEYTIIVISHKPDILKGFDSIYKVENKKVTLFKDN